MRVGRRTFLKLLAIFSAPAHTLLPGRAFAGESAAGIHRATRNTLLGAVGSGLREMRTAATPFKGYVGHLRIPLGARPVAAGPPLAHVLGRSHGSGTPRPDLTRDQLARLLFFTNGDTGAGDGDPYKLRAAPSAGALYAGEIYVLARAVDRLEPGAYYYDVGGHELVRVSNLDEGALRDVFEDPARANAAALVCLSNVFERYEQRYSNRGYRYALIDTGHIGENLRVAAAASAIAHRAEPRFCDDVLNRALGIDGMDETVCAVHVLGGGGAAVATSASHLGAPQEQVASRMTEKAVTGAKITTEPKPTLRYHEATKLVVGTPKARRGAGDARKHSEPANAPAGAGSVRLPDLASPPATGAEQCIAARRSPKAFARQPITAAQLGFVAAAAQPAAAAPASVELWLAFHRVEGLEPGLYRYVPERQGLAVVRLEDLTETLPRACLGQAKAADAAAGFLMIGRIHDSVVRHGERAYRDLLIEAGEIGERIYLAAEALGFSARNLASFLDEDLNALLGLDGSELAVLHLTMLGRGA